VVKLRRPPLAIQLQGEDYSENIKSNLRVVEMSITYYGRYYEEEKKIIWKDGLAALWILLKYRFVD